MNKNAKKTTIIIILLLLILLPIYFYNRYNLSYGETIFQKSIMAGCMQKMLVQNNHEKSKEVCECVVEYLNAKYSEEKLKNDGELDKILEVEKDHFSQCYKKYVGLTNIDSKEDSTKQYQLVGWIYSFGNNKIEEIQAYISINNDTIINQYKYFNNGVLDSSKSKFFNLVISGPKDSIMEGHINFFSPRDTVSQNDIYERDVSFTYLQIENDSLVFKEIKTDTNSITFPYKNFRDFTIMGYLSDLRFIKIKNTKDSLEVNKVSFAVDNKKFTENTYVELVK